MFVCECGKLVKEKRHGEIFVDYISTSQNPSTRTIGHRDCGLILNFVDGNWPKRYSSRKELKSLAANFAKVNKLSFEETGKFMLEVDKFKSHGKLSDDKILVYAYQKVLSQRALLNQSSESKV